MKKIIFFIPPVVFILFYGAIALFDSVSIAPLVIFWIALFIIAGILLSKSISFGALIGILPAVHLIYMSTQETGQVVNIEFPLGVIILIYYTVCLYWVYKKSLKK